MSGGLKGNGNRKIKAMKVGFAKAGVVMEQVITLAQEKLQDLYGEQFIKQQDPWGKPWKQSHNPLGRMTMWQTGDLAAEMFKLSHKRVSMTQPKSGVMQHLGLPRTEGNEPRMSLPWDYDGVWKAPTEERIELHISKWLNGIDG